MNASATAHYRANQHGSTNEIVERHGELVRRIAHHLAARLPASVEIDDLIQAGMLGLIDAARNFQADQGAAFETYASIRIRGAMIDEIRRGDWVPRSVHRRYRDMVAATREIEQRTGRAATPQQIAEALGVSLDEYHGMVENAARGQLVSLDAHMDEHDGEPRLASTGGNTPAREFENAAFREALGDAIGDLPEREQLVLSLYYEQELNLREIGAVLGVSESRVCQIHGQATVRLRARLGEWGGSQDDE
ncbi:RNA polymerase sigma factor FliA [Luteimonas notoginsengisoli]|uniref:RNA polymerase sigma factor FliA n=1 Tax=Luteimonas notoginsengisoli TaxID=1578200 RepID=A0ABV7UP14_9GAMM